MVPLLRIPLTEDPHSGRAVKAPSLELIPYGYLAQPKYTGKNLGPASNDVTDFVDSPWEASHSLRSRWG